MSSSPLGGFADWIEYIDTVLSEAEAKTDSGAYSAASGQLAGGLAVIRGNLSRLTSDRVFGLLDNDPDTLFLEWVSTAIYDDALGDFFDGQCLEAAAEFVDEDVLEDAGFRAAFVSLAEKRWATCPLARQWMNDDAIDVASARDRFMDGYGHHRDMTIARWCNEITDESFITEVMALMAHRREEHQRQVDAWRGDPRNPTNEDSHTSRPEETHV
jgi:hypothetical protein